MAKTQMEYVVAEPRKGKLLRRLAKIALVYIVVDNVVSNYAEYRKKRNENSRKKTKTVHIKVTISL